MGMAAGNFFISLVVFVVGLLACVLCDTIAPNNWTVANYPNPVTQGELCGKNRDVMYVCDPNNLLQTKEAQQLEVLIQDVMNNTACPCARLVCDRQGAPGFRIGVALMNKMNGTVNKDNSIGGKMRNNLHNARMFAHTFLERWGIGRCNEDLIILYSQNDTVLYTATGQETQIKLDGETAAEISQLVQRQFTPNGNKFEGLKEMITHYKSVFNGDYERMDRIVVSPQFEAVVGGSAKVATFTLMIVTLTLLAALF